MAQTEIDDILNSIRAENQVSNDMFGKTLTEINSKLEDIANDGITAELIKTTLQDVKTDLDNRYRFVTEKFENIKDAFEQINQRHDLLVTNSDLKMMFNLLNENIDHFTQEITQQQSLINDIETNLDEFRNDTSRKDEILERVAVVKDGIDEVNRGLQASIMEVNSSLRNITKNLMTMDATEQNDIIKRELENIYLAVNAVLSSMEILDQKNDDIAKNIVAKEDLINLTGKIDNSIALVSEKLDSSDNQASDNTEKIISEIEKNRNELLSFNENVSKGLSEYLNSVRDVLSNCIDEIKQSQAVNAVEDDSLARQKFENLEKLSDDIRKIDTTISSQNESYINLVSSKIKELGVVIDDFKKYVDERHGGIEENLQSKLDHLDILIASGSSMLQDRFGELQAKVEESIKSIETFAEDNSIKLGNSLSEMSDIKSEISRILENMTAFNSHQETNFSNFNNRLDGDLSELKDNLNGFCSSFEALKYTLEQSNIDNRGLLAEIVEDAANQTRSIVENLSSSTSENVLKNLDMQMELLKEQLNDLRNVFTSISAKNVENLLANIEQSAGRIDSLNSSLTENLDKNFQSMRDMITVSGSENSRQISEFEEKFTSVSQMNASGIMNEISAASSKIDSLNESLSGELNGNIQTIRDMLTASDSENRRQLAELDEKLVNVSQENASGIINEINAASSKIDSLNESLSGELNSNFSAIRDAVSFAENESRQQFDELGTKIVSDAQTNTGNIISEISTVSAKIDTVGVDLSTELDNNFEMVRDFIENSNEDKKQNAAEFAALSGSIKNLEAEFSKNTEKFQVALNEQMNSLENYISVLKECNSKEEDKNNYDAEFEALTEKLLAVETALREAGENFGDNLMMVQNKIADYAKSVDYVSKETGDKLETSLEEISSVKAELAKFIESLPKADDEASEKILATLNEIQAKFEDVLVNISDIKDDVNGNVTSSLQHNAAILEDKFLILQELLNDNNLKNFDRINDFGENLQNKIDGLKQEIGLVNTDISEIITARTEALSNDFIPLKESIDNFVNTDFNKIIDNIKSQIELSYLNFSADVNENMAENHDNYVQLNDAYQTLVDKFSRVEEVINDLSLNQIGVMTSTITEVESNIANNFDKTNELLESWKNDLKRIEAKIDTGSKNSELVISGSLKEFTNEIKTNSAVGANKIISNIETLGTGLKSEIASIKNTSAADAEKLSESINALNEKVDILAMSDPSANFEDLIDSVQEKIDTLISSDISGEKLKDIENAVENVSNKIDVLAMSDDTSKIEDIETSIKSIRDKIETLNLIDGSINFDEIENDIKSLHEKVDVLAFSADDIKLENIEEGLKSLHDKVDVIALSDNEEKIENMVQALHEKVDILASSEDDDLYSEIQDIKGLIVEQRKQIEQFGSSERSDNVDKYLEDLENRLSGLDFEKNASDIKDSVMNAILAVADQITFAEETEEIKDFVEERTDEINKNLLDVKQQLSNIACSSEAWDYSYTMQDIESDIAKLRIILNDISASTSKDEINEISQNMHKIAASVNTLHSSLTEEQILELKSDIEKINADVISLSARTNKLLLTSDESYKALTDGLDEFSRVTNQLQKRIDVLDNSGINEIIEKKLDNINDAVTSSANSDNIMRQVMLYLGEWIDEASEKLDTISTDTSNLSLMNSELCLLKTMIDNKEIVSAFEKKFTEQQKKINNLESKLEAVLHAVENHEDTALNRKIEIFDDKINSVDEKMMYLDEKISMLDEKLENLDSKLNKLSQGIEKLAAYVD